MSGDFLVVNVWILNYVHDVVFFYGTDGGDKDARDMIQIRYDQRRRQGLEMDSVFTGGLGKFEQHTKVINQNLCSCKSYTSHPNNNNKLLTNNSECVEVEEGVCLCACHVCGCAFVNFPTGEVNGNNT